MKKYRKLPVEVEALQWTGNNAKEMSDFTQIAIPWIAEHLHIHTSRGIMRASIGDWVIKGIEGELYPCKDSIFQKSYELVE